MSGLRNWLDINDRSPYIGVRNQTSDRELDRFMYASDHPWVDPKFIRVNLDSLNLSARDQEKVLSGTAKKLFGI